MAKSSKKRIIAGIIPPIVLDYSSLLKDIMRKESVVDKLLEIIEYEALYGLMDEKFE